MSDLLRKNTTTKMTSEVLAETFCFVFGDCSLAAPLAVDDCVQYIQGSCAEYLPTSVCVQADVLNLHLATFLVGGVFEGSIAFAKVFMLSDVMCEMLGKPLSLMLWRRLHDYNWSLPERSMNDDSAFLGDLAADAVAVRRQLLFARASLASGGSLFTEEVGGVLCLVGETRAPLRAKPWRQCSYRNTGVAHGRRTADGFAAWERLRRLMVDLVVEGRSASRHAASIVRSGYKAASFAQSGDATASELVATLCACSTVRRALLELDMALDLYTAASIAEAR